MARAGLIFADQARRGCAKITWYDWVIDLATFHAGRRILGATGQDGRSDDGGHGLDSPEPAAKGSALAGNSPLPAGHGAGPAHPAGAVRPGGGLWRSPPADPLRLAHHRQRPPGRPGAGPGRHLPVRGLRGLLPGAPRQFLPHRRAARSGAMADAGDQRGVDQRAQPGPAPLPAAGGRRPADPGRRPGRHGRRPDHQRRQRPGGAAQHRGPPPHRLEPGRGPGPAVVRGPAAAGGRRRPAPVGRPDPGPAPGRGGRPPAGDGAAPGPGRKPEPRLPEPRPHPRRRRPGDRPGADLPRSRRGARVPARAAPVGRRLSLQRPRHGHRPAGRQHLPGLQPGLGPDAGADGGGDGRAADPVHL